MSTSDKQRSHPIQRVARWLLAIAVAVMACQSMIARIQLNRITKEVDRVESERRTHLAAWEDYDSKRVEARKLHAANNGSLDRLSYANRDAGESLEDLLITDDYDLVVHEKVLNDTSFLFAANSHLHLPPGATDIQVELELQWDRDKPAGPMKPTGRFKHSFDGPCEIEMGVRIAGKDNEPRQLLISFTGKKDQVFPLPDVATKGWGRELPRFSQGMNELFMNEYSSLNEGVLPEAPLLYDHYVTLEQTDGTRGAVRIVARAISNQPLLVSPYVVDFLEYRTTQLQELVDRHNEQPMKSIQEMFKLHETKRWYEIQPHVIRAVQREGELRNQAGQ